MPAGSFRARSETRVVGAMGGWKRDPPYDRAGNLAADFLLTSEQGVDRHCVALRPKTGLDVAIQESNRDARLSTGSGNCPNGHIICRDLAAESDGALPLGRAFRCRIQE